MNGCSAQESCYTDQLRALHLQRHQSQTKGLIQRFSWLEGNFSTHIFRPRSLSTPRTKLYQSQGLGISFCCLHCETVCTIPGVVLPHVSHHSPRQYLVMFQCIIWARNDSSGQLGCTHSCLEIKEFNHMDVRCVLPAGVRNKQCVAPIWLLIESE